MKVQKIKKNLTSEMVIEEILKNLKSGDLQPGDKLPTEREMGRMFGVGRSSIREAVKGLVLLGYLEASQGKGTFVKADFAFKNLSPVELQSVMAAEDIFELMELRKILECNAVELAAKRADNDDKDRINKALEQMKACREDFRRFYKPDFDFHIAIATATHNKMISDMMRIVVEKAHEQYEKFMPDKLCPPGEAIHTAEQIAAGLIKGEGQKAVKHMKEHLKLVEIELKRVLSNHSDSYSKNAA
ncbi:MAG: hypothetical protein B6I22_10615 [Desulfobacteraceae bacterium 4572_123]|nr:MAG: hypothetical protein B6I22_10615 [Desulfobacteraceae bacterium 4572_123]